MQNYLVMKIKTSQLMLRLIHFYHIQLMGAGHGGFHVNIPVSGVTAVQQAFPETSAAGAAHIGDAAVHIIHVAIGAHPDIALLQHIKPRLTQLPGGCNQLWVGICTVLDEYERETHGVRYSA